MNRIVSAVNCKNGLTSYKLVKKYLKKNTKRMVLLKTVLLYKKNDSVEESTILLDTDLKIILLNHQNNFVGILKIIRNAPKFLIF